MTKPIIALDADGVLLDYSTAYGHAWACAFGEHPVEQDPCAYWPVHRWGVERLSGAQLDRFRACFHETFWSSVPAIEGAVEACQRLHDSGHELICVSALEPAFQQSRLRNLRDLGFPIERVTATGSKDAAISPKAKALQEIRPVAFVDDYLPYFRGLPDGIHAALILRLPNGSPNVGPELKLVHSRHRDLQAFVDWWLSARNEPALQC
jgi:phosphoglycolate phosphatase-like HAD superfamily hydrolase